MSFSAAVFAFSVMILFLVYRKKIFKFIQYRNTISKLPKMTETAYPLIGHSYLLSGNPSQCFHHLISQGAKYIKQSKMKFLVRWLGPVAVIHIYHPDAAQVILKSAKHMEKSYMYNFLHPWLGTGLLTSEGAKWKQRRRLITPSFHFNILQDFLDVMNEQSQIMIKNITKQCEDGKSVDLSKAVTLCALDIICETAMGQSVNAQTDEDSLYFKTLHKMTDLIQLRQKTPFLWWDFVFKMTKTGKEQDQVLNILHSFTRKVIKNKMSSSSETTISKKRMAFLDVLMHAETDDGKSLSISDIQEEVDTFMFEGHDTTAAAMTWAIYLIGRHPEVQKRIQDELTEVFGDDIDRSATMEDLRKLVYLEQVLKESLRLFPAVPMMARVTSEDCEIEGYAVPAGTQVVVFVYIIHHNPEVWKDPEVFDPERFSAENSAGRHPFAFIPFSAGPRNCIGQRFALLEEKVILSQLLRHFTITSHDKREDIKMVGDVVLRPAKPLNISLSKITV